MDIKEFLKSNYSFKRPIVDDWEKYIALYKSWYLGKVKGFHDYRIYNGASMVPQKRLSLQMAKKSCEDWADLLFNERCSVSVKNEQSGAILEKILGANNFYTLINHAIECSGASGTGALVVSVENIALNSDANTADVTEANTKIRYVDADGIYPISWDEKNVTECAFAAEGAEKGRKIVYLSVHMSENGRYVIYNHKFEDKNGTLQEVESDAIPKFETGSAVKWFSMISPSGVNQIYPSSPWGLPYFANSIDNLKVIDNTFDSLNNEILLGRKRIFVRQDLLNVTPDGTKLTFDPNDISVYVLPKMATEQSLIYAENSELRIDQLTKALETQLNTFSASVGFGDGHYRFSGFDVETATAVISNNSAMFRRKKKHEAELENCLYDLITAVAYASTKFGSKSIDISGLKINFDDSIVEDKNAMSSRALRELSAGVISPSEYRERIFGETPEIAKAKVAEIRESYPTMSQLIGE